MNKVIDCLLLNAMWVFCCIPLVTAFFVAVGSNVVLYWAFFWLTFAVAGPATVALYYTVNKVIRHSRSYVWKEYWYAFRSNFKQGAAAGLIVAALGLFMVLDAYIMYQFAVNGGKGSVLYIVFIVFILLIAVWGLSLIHISEPTRPY